MVARKLVSTMVQHSTHNQALYRLRLRASSFFSTIEPILERYHIPPDFKYLPLVESALRSTAVSPKGAAGYWQFMPQTARELGLTVRPGRDDRQNLLKSTDAACRYLRDLHNQLGSWTLAAAAYNIGINRLLYHIRRQQEADYYYLKLNPETARYLYRIVAFKELFTNYRSYDEIISPAAMATLSIPLPGGELENEYEVLIPEILVESVEAAAGDGAVEVKNLPTTTRQKLTDIQSEEISTMVRTGVKATLVEASGLEAGQVWVFKLSRGTDVRGAALDEGDLLYAVIENIDARRNKLFLRVEKAYSVQRRNVLPAFLSAIDASTGQSGIPLPDLEEVRAGWVLTLKPL
ncbi:lytic transglycosylase domain-containing protein [Tellurirhabdus bombi]|uniref:lytic transglycosylase domain-containing protein n=1 Tax=Tellurirhabdus bombi TaxID=2907205 RepID=UPI001F327D1F|nr:lytic transglycosylase domain-containing protein [Tellurirhabdus bombi]